MLKQTLFSSRFLTVAVVLYLMTNLVSVAVAQQQSGPPSARGVPLEPVDTSKLGEISLSQVLSQMNEFSTITQLLEKAAKILEENHDGTPESATKIALVKMKLLERISKSIPLAIRELERFRVKNLIEQSRYESDCSTILSQITELEKEIADLSSKVKVVDGDLQGDDTAIALLAVKIERADEMSSDHTLAKRASESIAQSLATMDKLENRIQGYTSITREEVRRQSDAMRRSRLAKNSALLNSEAVLLLSIGNSLEPAFASLPRSTPSLVVPDMAAVTLSPPVSSITPEIKAKVLARLRNTGRQESTNNR